MKKDKTLAEQLKAAERELMFAVTYAGEKMARERIARIKAEMAR